MTYLASRNRGLHARYGKRRAPAAPPVAMGGLLTDIGIAVFGGPVGWSYLLFREAGQAAFGKPDVIDCLARANTQFMGMEEQINDLAKNWTPTGYYSPSDIAVTISYVTTCVVQAIAAVSNAPNSTSDAVSQKANALAELQRKSAESAAYTSASAQGQSQDGIIDAPGFKRWVISTMNVALSAQITAAVLSCEVSFAEAVIARFKSAWNTAVAIIRAIVGVAWEIAKSLGKLIIKVPDTLSDLLTYAKWAAILGGSAWLIIELTNKRNAGTHRL